MCNEISRDGWNTRNAASVHGSIRSTAEPEAHGTRPSIRCQCLSRARVHHLELQSASALELKFSLRKTCENDESLAIPFSCQHMNVRRLDWVLSSPHGDDAEVVQMHVPHQRSHCDSQTCTSRPFPEQEPGRVQIRSATYTSATW
jgi:hypothetical protein